AALSGSEGIEEAFVFSTCNRTEFVVWGDPTLAENSVLRFLAANYDLRLCEWKNFYRLLDEQALAHAFRVSCGLDSMRVGEGQIGRQVNAAWQQAKRAGCTGPFLDAVLRRALGVRRRVRKEVAAGTRPESAPQVAVDLAGELFGSFTNCSVLVMGAGAMGRAAAQELRSRGAKSVCVLDSRNEWALDVSARLGIQAAAFAERGKWLAAADLVISATSAAGFVVTADELWDRAAARAGRKQVVMDLALPRDVDPRVRQIEGILLYDLDDLERSVKPPAGAHETAADAEKVILDEVQEFRKELAAQDTRTEISAIQHRLDEICRQELETFRLEQGPFPKEQDQMIAAVSSRITHRIAGSLARQLRTRP
ncbi:MAG: glutamyl-tRNA reductase, partial [Deltaproteobacteria bacterium]